MELVLKHNMNRQIPSKYYLATHTDKSIVNFKIKSVWCVKKKENLCVQSIFGGRAALNNE